MIARVAFFGGGEGDYKGGSCFAALVPFVPKIMDPTRARSQDALLIETPLFLFAAWCQSMDETIYEEKNDNKTTKNDKKKGVLKTTCVCRWNSTVWF